MELNLFKLGSAGVGNLSIDQFQTLSVEDTGGGYVDTYVMPVDSSPTLYTQQDPISAADVQSILLAPTGGQATAAAPVATAPAPVDQAPAVQVSQTGTAQTVDTSTPVPDYIDSYGHFIDKTGNYIKVKWQWFNTVTGEVYSQQTSDAFHVWGDTDLANVAIRATAPGFSKVHIMALDLPPETDIMLEKPSYALYAAAIAALILFAKKRHKQVGAVSMTDVEPFMLIGGGVLAYIVVNQILVSLGIWKSKDTRELDAASTDPNSPWSTEYYLNLLAQGVTWSSGINTATADKWLQDIDDAFSFFGDNETVVKGILKRCRTQATLSFLAWEYNHNTGGDFLSYLRGQEKWYPWGGLSDADINEVNHYILQLPKY